MPFIKPEDRDKVEKYRNDKKIDTSDWTVGDWCYYYYKPMVDEWKKEPRWTTAHNIYRQVVLLTEGKLNFIRNYKIIIETEFYFELNQISAYKLAWQVFFQNYVMPYEKIKQEENGDI